MQNKLDINLTIFQLGEIFRELVPFVFEALGKDPDDTTFETFNHIGRLRSDSETIGFYSFRNGEFFYWVFMKITHRSSITGGGESLLQEFEVQIKKSEAPVVQIYSEKDEAGEGVSISKELTPLDWLNFEAEDEYADFTEAFIRKIKAKAAGEASEAAST
jgi:hypothetical protein